MNTWEAVKLVFSSDKRKEVEEVRKVKEAAARDPKKVAIKKLGQAIKDGGADFEESVVDLAEIQRAYFSDSYIRRSVDKYAELMFKEGWEIPGRNEAATEYVWMRLKLMGEATGQPIQELMKEIAHDIVLFGNAFVVKARQKTGGGATGVTAVGYTGKQPIAGYFVLPATSIMIARDETGKILNYQQDIGTGTAQVFKAEDIVHFHYKRPRGRAFGVPYIYNALDDVKLLRQIEENVARLIYRNLFPIYQYKVGIDKPGYEATDEEVEELREEIRDMPMDGALVVPERHEITVIGSQGQALDASEYLKYYRQRVFTGLMVSDSTMGIGDSANKSTSDNQAADLIDGAKEFQSIFATTFTDKIVNELLFEGGYDPVLNMDDEVTFEFFEIALDAKTKKENHVVQLFTQNAISFEEMRAAIGRDPVSDEGRLYFNMITIATAQAQANITAQAQAANNVGDNKDQPENQSGKAKSPGKAKREGNENPGILSKLEENATNVLTPQTVMVNLYSEQDVSKLNKSSQRMWNSLREDMINMTDLGKSQDFIKRLAVEPFKESVQSTYLPFIESLLTEGANKGQVELEAKTFVPSSVKKIASREIASLISKSIGRVIDDVLTVVMKAEADQSAAKRASLITGAFESNQYRLALITQAELHRAFNYGKMLMAKEAGLESVTSKINSTNPSQKCKEQEGKAILLNQANADLLKQVPAYHPNCQCTIELVKPAEEV